MLVTHHITYDDFIMGYQALLFCPDEKLARVVSQVFGELDFTVEPVHEPFAAVKRLMAQRYDAIVVDCENEQNASLLFKSARNSSSNQSSLAIALVEGQAGVAKAYRIGANLVLTKPINVEQAKGTLRVARGLLRKNSDAAASAAASATPVKPTSVSADSSFQSPSRGAAATTPPSSHNDLPEFEASLPEAMPARVPAEVPAATASAQVEDKAAVALTPVAQAQATIAVEPAREAQQSTPSGIIKNDSVKSNATKDEAAKSAVASAPVQNPSSNFTAAAGSAAAPAPAKKVTPQPTKENTKVEPELINPSNTHPSHATPSPEAASVPMADAGSTSDAPSFAALGEEDGGGSGSSKKILTVIAVVLALAALIYFGYGKLEKASAPAPQPASAPQSSQQPAPVPAPSSSPAGVPSTNTADLTLSTTQTSAAKTASAASLDKPSAGAGNAPVIRVAAENPETVTKKTETPIRVKSNPKTRRQADEAEPAPPSPVAVASANDSNLSGLMASANVARPSLSTVRISQGVSQGLVIKRVQPKYPATALAVHASGAVQIEATINKEGNVTNLKVLSGDAILAHAALEAVRQWRYKPYYLDGQPVEIQTQITVNFKAN